MPRLTDLISKCLKYTEREAMEKRRVVVVAIHGGGIEEKRTKNDQNPCSSLLPSNLGRKSPVNLHIPYKWYNLSNFISWPTLLPYFQGG